MNSTHILFGIPEHKKPLARSKHILNYEIIIRKNTGVRTVII